MKAFQSFKEDSSGTEAFSITFGNGNTISVVFGKGTYSDQGETTAEVAAWDSNGDWMLFQDGAWITIKQDSEVMPRCTPTEVAEMMFALSMLPKNN
jgi:hypothetical protein